MRHPLLTGVTFLMCLLVAGRLAADESHQKSAKLETKVEIKLDYLLYLPSDYEKQDAWPLVVFLHGAGERGDNLELVKTHGPPKLIEAGKSFPFICVSPQCPKDRWWTTQPLQLTALIDSIVANYKVDLDRIYLTGISMGGFGTWMLAGYSPDRFAAIAPICGGGELIGIWRLSAMPVWAFHGAKDPLVPVNRSEVMVEALQRQNNPEAKLTVYPEAEHDSWTETYENPELYEWLLSHKRKPKEKPAP